MINIKSAPFNAVGDGVTDDTAAIQAAITYAQTFSTSSPYTGEVVYFPAGEYLVSSTITVSKSNIYLRGEGKGVTLIARNAAYNHTFAFDSGGIIQNVGISGMTIFHDVSLGHVMTGGHVYFNAALHFKCEDMNIQAGGYGIISAGGVYGYINNCHLQGDYISGNAAKNSTVGLYFIPTTVVGAVPIATIINVTNTQINSTTSVNLYCGYRYGCVINGAEEMHFTNCTFNGCYYTNMYLQQLNDNRPILEITYDSCFFDGMPGFSFWVDGATGNGSQCISRIRLNNCGINGEGFTAAYGNGYGIYIDPTNRGGTYPQALMGLQVSNSTIQGCYSDGIYLSGNDIILTGNNIFQNNKKPSGTANGITVTGTTSRFSIVGGSIGGVNGSTDLQKYAITVASGASDFIITGVDTTKNTTGGILNSSTSPSKLIANNL